jgi:hypothetical protein
MGRSARFAAGPGVRFGPGPDAVVELEWSFSRVSWFQLLAVSLAEFESAQVRAK